MSLAQKLADQVGIAKACAALAINRADFYRHFAPRPKPPPRQRPTPERALSETERQAVLDVLNSERFCDKAPAEVYATLLDQGIHLCSIRTMYRLLEEEDAVRERRNQLTHPSYKKPELLATGPNQVWSWDITKLLGPQKWQHFHLYVILDIFSRYVVGWLIAEAESDVLAEQLIAETLAKQGIAPGQLTLHADRGSSMKSKTVAQLLSDLGVEKTHSRPHVSDDNPFSEAQFKTLKYRPEFPERFGSIEDARAFCRVFFAWYNQEHHHSGLALHTPADVHDGRAEQVRATRQRALDEAYQANPERFVKRPPQAPRLPKAVWINPPKSSEETRPPSGRVEAEPQGLGGAAPAVQSRSTGSDAP
jgi:putative transposase